MLNVNSLTVNPFAENTYILSSDTGEAIIFDAGMSNRQEEKLFDEQLTILGVKPVRLINTHCHIDHVLGNDYMHRNYDLTPEYHPGEQVVMDSNVQVASMYQLKYFPSPNAVRHISSGEIIEFGGSLLKAIYTPGHSPASLSFYCEDGGFVIAGDVLFYMSIGRYDLPGGDGNVLMASIREQLFTLPDDTIVYPGHGPSTTIGFEKANNPFSIKLNGRLPY